MATQRVLSPSSTQTKNAQVQVEESRVEFSVNEKLTEWGLAKYIDAFEREEVDEFTFLNVPSEVVLQRLITTIGPYTKFICQREKLKELLKKKSDSTDAIKQVEVEDSLDEPHEPPPSDGNASNVNCTRGGEFAERQALKRGHTPAEPSLLEKRSKSNKENKVLTILQNCVEGRSLLKWPKDKKLKEPQTLANIIIRGLIEDTSTAITKEEFKKITSELIEVFPSEDPKVYYIPPIPKTPGQKDRPSIDADGKLYLRYRNQLKRLREAERYLEQESTEENESCNETGVLSVAVSESIQWLKHNKEPLEELKIHWRATSRARYDHIVKNGDNTMSNYFQSYPVLKQSWGHRLISIDFEELYKIKDTDIFVEWPLFFERFYKTANRRNFRTVGELIGLLDEDITEHSKIFVQLLLLPYIFPPHFSTTNKRGKDRFKHKPTIIESQSSIIVHAKTAAELIAIHDAKVNDAYRKLMNIQPYIVAVGPSYKEIINYVIVLDEVRWECDSPLKAFQIFFQMFHVMFGEYPFDCKHILYLIQRILFKLETDHDKFGSDVRIRIGQLMELEKLQAPTT